MTLTLNNAVTYDIETFPNCFTLAMECLHNDQRTVWEISDRRDDRQYLMEWFTWLAQTQTPMIGFNTIHFDYPVIHALFHNPQMSVAQIYEKAMSIIQGGDRFAHSVWASDRFAPQIDLFKIHHFDNRAKSTSLKWLQINMRSRSVVDMPVEVGTNLTSDQIDQYLIPYNHHDVSETKAFAHYSMSAINFRVGLIDQFGVDVLNWSDSKIGSQMVVNKLGDEVCYDRSSGRRQTRQTPRTSIPINDIIFPYIRLENPEFKRVEDYLRGQTLKSENVLYGHEVFWDGDTPVIKTKGVFSNLHANVAGMEFHFGVGGIHGSVERKRFQATDEWLIKDIDVASLYPSIAIVNKLRPAHLGEAFTNVYSELPKERKRWQQEKGKKCVEANAIKLGANSVYGNSNNMYSPFYDPQYTTTITINGQLMLCMLAEQLVKVPTLQLIQINTDGMTYVVHRDYLEQTKQIERWWEGVTQLVLEDQFYTRMWVRDVNSYIAESFDGSLKLKGAYWFPDPDDYHGSVSESQPPAWHKNLSNITSVRAAVEHMVNGVDHRTWLVQHDNPFDFMCAVKAKGKDKLYYGDKLIQRTTRYYVTIDGEEMIKVAPPPVGKRLGAYKKASGVTDHEYERIMNEMNWQWDERVCTKNKSTYQERRTAVCAGYKVRICNNAGDFDRSKINYNWYAAEAEKLII